MAIAPLNRGKSLTDLAYEHLKELILNRTLAPGQVVTEVWLSEQLGVSRTPVRQAVSKLASEGLISMDNGRIQVRRITRHEAKDVSDLRVAIEGHTARTLAERGVGEPALGELRRTIDALDDLVDPSGGCTDTAEFMRINRDFHRQLAEETGNALLVDATERVLDLIVLSGLTILATRERARHVVKEHRAILDAIVATNPDAAYFATKAHALGIDLAEFPWLFGPDEE